MSKDGANVGFEIDGQFELIEGKKACDYSCKYQSVIGNGKIKILEDLEEKKKGLNAIMKQNTGKTDFEYNPKMIQNVSVYMLSVTKLSCKGHL